MKNLKKVFALLLALSLLCVTAFAEEVEEPAGTKKTGELNEMATTLDRTLSVEIVPEVAINDPGRIKLTVEWIQPSLTFTNKSIAYENLTKSEGNYVDATAAQAVLTALNLDKEKEEDAATITALENAVADEANPLKNVNYYLLGADKDVAFTLSNESVSSIDKTFKGQLEITAKTNELDIKGIKGVLTTPTEKAENPDGGEQIDVQAPLKLKSKATCAEEAEKITGDDTAKANALNAYINKTAYKYTYQNKEDFLPGFTKEKDEEGKDTANVAPYYTATPEAKDVIKDLTTTVTFTVKIVQEAVSEE